MGLRVEMILVVPAWVRENSNQTDAIWVSRWRKWMIPSRRASYLQRSEYGRGQSKGNPVSFDILISWHTLAPECMSATFLWLILVLSTNSLTAHHSLLHILLLFTLICICIQDKIPESENLCRLTSVNRGTEMMSSAYIPQATSQLATSKTPTPCHHSKLSLIRLLCEICIIGANILFKYLNMRCELRCQSRSSLAPCTIHPAADTPLLAWTGLIDQAGSLVSSETKRSFVISGPKKLWGGAQETWALGWIENELTFGASRTDNELEESENFQNLSHWPRRT